MNWSSRRVSLIVLLAGAGSFAVVAALLVPWHPVPWPVGPAVDPSSVFTSEQIARAEAFAGRARALSLFSLGISLLVVSLLGFTRRGRALAGRLPGPWPVAVALAVAAVLVVGRLATLPLTLLLRDHLHAYGLSNQSLSGWTVDLVTSLLVQLVMTWLLLVTVIGSARRWPRSWPAVAGGVLAVLVLAGSWVYPVVVEPLFNHFTTLPDGPLRSAVFDLAAREGVHIDDVLVADASRRTTTLNAYVSGFGDTRRVVLYDNLVDDEPQAETLSVVAHELGHAKHDDVLVGSVLGALGALVGAGALGLLLAGDRRRLLTSGAAAVPLVMALSAWATLLTAPIENGISREIETRADVSALETARDPAAFVAVQRQLAVRSLSDPTPPAVLQWWFGSHPTVLDRIQVAEE